MKHRELANLRSTVTSHYLFIYLCLIGLGPASSNTSRSVLPPPIVNFDYDSLIYAVFKPKGKALTCEMIREN